VEATKSNDHVSAGLVARTEGGEELKTMGWYDFECYDSEGNLKWVDRAYNVVATQGKNFILDQVLGLVNPGSNVLRVGLSTTTGVAGDTYATRGTLVEGTSYSGNRGTPSFAAASGGAKATSAAVAFSITGTMTVTGAILVYGNATNLNTPGDTGTASAILISTGSFSGGSRAVINGDTLNVTYTLTLT
jgi:hypothetical protein